MPLSGPSAPPSVLALADLPIGEWAEVVGFDLTEREVEPLLERGVLPECRIANVRRSPSGDPVVEVDGVMIAMRRETASRIRVRRLPCSEG